MGEAFEVYLQMVQRDLNLHSGEIIHYILFKRREANSYVQAGDAELMAALFYPTVSCNFKRFLFGILRDLFCLFFK